MGDRQVRRRPLEANSVIPRIQPPLILVNTELLLVYAPNMDVLQFCDFLEMVSKDLQE